MATFIPSVYSGTYQSHTNMPSKGHRVRNTNKKCKHFGSEGVVTAVNSLPGDKGKTISYKCTNDGDSWDRGQVLTKTPDQLSPLKGESLSKAIARTSSGQIRAIQNYHAKENTLEDTVGSIANTTKILWTIRLISVPIAFGLSYTRNKSVGLGIVQGVLFPWIYLGYRGIQAVSKSSDRIVTERPQMV